MFIAVARPVIGALLIIAAALPAAAASYSFVPLADGGAGPLGTPVIGNDGRVAYPIVGDPNGAVVVVTAPATGATAVGGPVTGVLGIEPGAARNERTILVSSPGGAYTIDCRVATASAADLAHDGAASGTPVAFLTGRGGPGAGTALFVSRDGAARPTRVIRAGDALFGSTVVRLWFAANGINDSGQLVFLARLADGRTLIVRADPDDARLATAAVTDARDRCAAATTPDPIVLIPPVWDLRVTSVSDPPANALAGQSFPIDDTTRNDGTTDVGISVTRFFLSAVDGNRDPTDYAIGFRTVPALNAGTESSGTTTVRLPRNMNAGTYFVIACSDSQGLYPETTGDNNCHAAVNPVDVAGPRLQIDVPTIPSPLVVGSQFVTSTTVQNIGNAAAGASTVRYFLSLDGVKDPADPRLGSLSVPGLAVSQSFTSPVTLKVPAGLTPGSYVLIACTDALGEVAELVENDHCRASSAATITSKPDLVVTALSDPPAIVNIVSSLSFSVTDTTQNQGGAPAGSSRTRYFLSFDQTRHITDFRFSGYHSVGPLAAGASHTATRSITFPPVPGTYFLIACADAGHVVDEGDETNNCRASVGTVTINNGL